MDCGYTVTIQLLRHPETDLMLAVAHLGHSRLDTTARYSRPTEKDLAAERLG